MSKHTAEEVLKYLDHAPSEGFVGPTAYEMLRAYADLLAAQEKAEVVAWIPVGERLPQGYWGNRNAFPDVSEQVIIRTLGGVGCAAYDRAKSAWFSGDLAHQQWHPSHVEVIEWQPLPPAPKGE